MGIIDLEYLNQREQICGNTDEIGPTMKILSICIPASIGVVLTIYYWITILPPIAKCKKDTADSSRGICQRAARQESIPVIIAFVWNFVPMFVILAFALYLEIFKARVTAAFVTFCLVHTIVVSTWARNWRGKEVNDEDMKCTLTPRNVYQDFGCSIVKVLFTFFIQLILVSMMALSVFYTDELPCTNQVEVLVLIICGIVVRSMYFSIEYQNKAKNYKIDAKLWGATKKATEGGLNKYEIQWKETPDENSDILSREITWYEWYLRRYLDHIANGLFDNFLYILAVLEVGKGDLKNFVVDFLSMRFITSLDDNNAWGNFESKFEIVPCEPDNPSAVEPEPQVKESDGDQKEGV